MPRVHAPQTLTGRTTSPCVHVRARVCVPADSDAVNPGLSVTISGTEPRRDSEGRIFTVRALHAPCAGPPRNVRCVALWVLVVQAYVIKVEQEGSDVKWAVVRRYRDFFELDKMVRTALEYRCHRGKANRTCRRFEARHIATWLQT